MTRALRELDPLRSFLVLAEVLHFGRVAARLGLSQSALSQRIAALERELGVTLFERSRRSVKLTDAGAQLAARLRPALDEVREALDEARRQSSAHPRLRLGYLDFVNLPFLAATLRRLRAAHPEIVVERRELWSREVCDALLEGSLDVGFAFLPVTAPGLAFRPALVGQWVILLPAHHRLAAHRSVPLRALRGEPLILFERALNPPLHDWLLGRFEAAGVSPQVAYATAQPPVAVELVREGVGAFVVASYVVRDLPAGVVARPLEGFDAELRMAAVWNGERRTAVVRHFLSALPPELPVHAPLPGA